MRERMKHHVRRTEELARLEIPFLTPVPQTAFQLLSLLLHRDPLFPVVHQVLVQLQEQSFTLVLDGGNPGGVDAELTSFQVEVELAVDVGRGIVEPGVPDECRHLAQSVDDQDAIHGLGPPVLPLRRRMFYRVEDAFVLVPANHGLTTGQQLELGLPDLALGRTLLAGPPSLDDFHDLVVIETGQGGSYLGNPAEDGQHSLVWNYLQMALPHLADGRVQRQATIRERDDAEGLREVGVAGGPDEQPVELVAGLTAVGGGAHPLLAGIASSQGRVVPTGCLADQPAITAVTADTELGQLARGPQLVKPEPSVALLRSAVDELGPVDVPHVAVLAGPDETDWHHAVRARLGRVTEIVAFVETGRRINPAWANQQARLVCPSGRIVLGLRLLGKRPPGEPPDNHTFAGQR